MSRKPQKNDSPEMGSSDDDVENSSRKDAADGDDDFDFNENNGTNDQQKTKKNIENDKKQVIQNQPFDEAFEVSEGGSEIASDNGPHSEEEDKQANNSTDEPLPKPQAKQQIQGNIQKIPPKTIDQNQLSTAKKDDSEEEEQETEQKIPGAYNPSDYAHLNVTPEIEDLFKHITRYKPITVDIDSKLKPFIPDYIPAVGEVDAFLKPSRPDDQPETLGLLTIDEPCLNQSKKSKLDLEIKEFIKKKKGDSTAIIHSIENADKNPKEILSWVNDVSEIHKKKQPPSVVYTKPFPEIEQLMQEWPLEVEDALQNLKLPTEEVDMDLSQYCKLACALLDIPVHNTTNQKNLIESLHVFFTLYSEFRANPHFQEKSDQYQGFEQNNQQSNQEKNDLH